MRKTVKESKIAEEVEKGQEQEQEGRKGAREQGRGAGTQVNEGVTRHCTSDQGNLFPFSFWPATLCFVSFLRLFCPRLRLPFHFSSFVFSFRRFHFLLRPSFFFFRVRSYLPHPVLVRSFVRSFESNPFDFSPDLHQGKTRID